ncbi:MAG: CPBP family intramembrane glutamic endopeptidase [Aquihabitans sp.]
MTSTLNPLSHAETRPRREPPSAGEGRPRREILTYLALTYGLGLTTAVAIPGTKENPGPVSLFALLTPALVVALIRLVARVRHTPANPHPLGLRRAGFRSWPAAVLLPLGAMAASYGLAYMGGVVSFDGLAEFVISSPINIVIMSVLVLGEEIGWRSYLLPRLASVMPVRRASLVTGFCQGLFHLPLLLLTPAYDGDGSRWIVVPGLLCTLTAAGAVFGWLRTRSGSLWPAAIAHATVNTFILETPVLVSENPDLAAYLTGEAGIFTIVGIAVMALLVVRRGSWTQRDTEPALTHGSSLDAAPQG